MLAVAPPKRFDFTLKKYNSKRGIINIEFLMAITLIAAKILVTQKISKPYFVISRSPRSSIRVDDGKLWRSIPDVLQSLKNDTYVNFSRYDIKHRLDGVVSIVNTITLILDNAYSLLSEIREDYKSSISDAARMFKIITAFIAKDLLGQANRYDTSLWRPLFDKHIMLSILWNQTRWAMLRFVSRKTIDDTHSKQYIPLIESSVKAICAYLISDAYAMVDIPHLAEFWSQLSSAWRKCAEAYLSSIQSSTIDECSHLIASRISNLQDFAVELHRDLDNSSSPAEIPWMRYEARREEAYKKEEAARRAFTAFLEDASQSPSLERRVSEAACQAMSAWFEAYRAFSPLLNEIYLQRLSSSSLSSSNEHSNMALSPPEEDDHNQTAFLRSKMRAWAMAVVSPASTGASTQDLKRFPFCSLIERKEVAVEEPKTLARQRRLLLTLTSPRYALVEETQDSSICFAASYLQVFEARSAAVLEAIHSRLRDMEMGSIVCEMKDKRYTSAEKQFRLQFHPVSIDNFLAVERCLVSLSFTFERERFYSSSGRLERAEEFLTHTKDSKLQYNLLGASSGGVSAMAAWKECSGPSSEPRWREKAAKEEEKKAVVVAVVDTGISATHRDLFEHMWTRKLTAEDLTERTFFNNPRYTAGLPINGCSFNQSVITDDLKGHGTHVAGIIAADVRAHPSGLITAGVASGVELMACRASADPNSIPACEVIRCLEFARKNGASLINLSIDSLPQGCSKEQEEMKNCQDEGIIVVVAAGNSAKDLDSTKLYPACYDLENIVTVAASTEGNTLWQHSNYGQEVDICAPGENIYSTDSMALEAYTERSGTSMAAPHVTAALAMLAQRHPELDYRQRIERVKTLSDPLRGKGSYRRLNMLSCLSGTQSSEDYLSSIELDDAIEECAKMVARITEKLKEMNKESTKEQMNQLLDKANEVKQFLTQRRGSGGSAGLCNVIKDIANMKLNEVILETSTTSAAELSPMLIDISPRHTWNNFK